MRNNSNYLEKQECRIKYLERWLSEGVDISTTIDFLDSLKKGLSLLLPSSLLGQRKFYWNFKTYKQITRDDLSLFLGQKKHCIKEIIRSARIDSTYLMSLEFINSIESNLRIKLNAFCIPKHLINKFINKIINAYVKKHNPPYSNRFKSKKFHPKLKENYFKNIDTIEKAYWLGVLWADGWISENRWNDERKPNYTLGLKQSVKHKNLIKDYCNTIGFNSEYLKKYQDKKSKTWYYLAQLINNRFVIPLIRHGFIVGKRKSLNLKLPILNSIININEREIYLGFLLGYYDGDGTKGRTYITSGSFKFIEQIKKYFKINNEVIEDTYQKKDGTQGKTYKLALGRDLMCEMLNNYQNSFKPKRKAIGPFLKAPFHKLVDQKKKTLIRERSLK